MKCFITPALATKCKPYFPFSEESNKAKEFQLSNGEVRTLTLKINSHLTKLAQTLFT